MSEPRKEEPATAGKLGGPKNVITKENCQNWPQEQADLRECEMEERLLAAQAAIEDHNASVIDDITSNCNPITIDATPGVWLSPADALNAAIDDARKPLVEALQQINACPSKAAEIATAALASVKGQP